MTDESSAAEALIEWAEQVLADEEHLVIGEREAEVIDALLASLVDTGLLALEAEQGGGRVADLSSAQLRTAKEGLREATATAERLLDEITGDPR